MVNRRSAFSMLALGLASSSVYAEDPYPNRMIRCIVPFPAGGGVDITTRMIMQPLSERLRQAIVIENKDGGGGLVGTRIASQSKPDGYSLVSQSFNILTFHTLVKNRGFDVQKDFVPISLLTFFPMVLTVPFDSPAKTLEDLVRMARASKEGITFGTGSLGGGAHLAAAMFQKLVASQTRIIPYKGSAPMSIDLSAGRLDASFTHIGSISEFMKAGKVRGLAISAPSRSPLYPAVPTMIESGYADFDVSEFVMLFVAGGAPAGVTQKIYTEIKAVLSEPETKSKLEAIGAIIVSTTPTETSSYIQKKSEEYGKLLVTLGMQPI